MNTTTERAPIVQTWKDTESTRCGPFERNHRREFTFSTTNGRVYQTERHTVNGVTWFHAQYPADTEYARARIGK